MSRFLVLILRRQRYPILEFDRQYWICNWTRGPKIDLFEYIVVMEFLCLCRAPWLSPPNIVTNQLVLLWRRQMLPDVSLAFFSWLCTAFTADARNLQKYSVTSSRQMTWPWRLSLNSKQDNTCSLFSRNTIVPQLYVV